MKYLSKLIRPPTERPVLLDLFMGSGSTLAGAREHGWRVVGIDLEEEHCKTAVKRLIQGVLPLAG
jgi:site-specific DNA-methyltransferase (adenine-specific)